MNKDIINEKLNFISECAAKVHQYNKNEIEKAINYQIVEIKKQLFITDVVGQSEQFNCGKERVFGEIKCDKQCSDCIKEYGSN